LNISDFPSGNQDGDFLYWSQGSWIKLAPGNPGQSIIIGNFGLPNWGCLIPSSADTTMSNLGQTFVVNTLITPIRISTTGVTGIEYAQNLPQGLVASWSANVITITGSPTQAGNRSFTIYLEVSCGEPLSVSGRIDVINATVPDAPTGVVATAGDGSASVAFMAPTNNGGSDITNYRVTSTPGGFEVLGGTSPITVNYLTNGTPYKFTVVAENLVGKSVASAASSAVTPAPVCPATTVEDKVGNEYNTVGIGTQCWMKENLKVTKYNNGDDIPDGTANTSGWGALTTGARTEYVSSGVTGYVSTYGYLYNWYAATDSRKICPTDWHVPTDAEWTTLTTELGGESLAGTVMKKSDVLWTTNSGTNTSGFSALPGGFRNLDGDFNVRDNAFFWSATENDSLSAWIRTLNYDNSFVYRDYYSKSVGASVRCLRD
jgi:uncharacterized protein (TIGR02145 family)